VKFEGSFFDTRSVTIIVIVRIFLKQFISLGLAFPLTFPYKLGRICPFRGNVNCCYAVL
jgi:hypothetical protein